MSESLEHVLRATADELDQRAIEKYLASGVDPFQDEGVLRQLSENRQRLDQMDLGMGSLVPLDAFPQPQLAYYAQEEKERDAETGEFTGENVVTGLGQKSNGVLVGEGFTQNGHIRDLRVKTKKELAATRM